MSLQRYKNKNKQKKPVITLPLEGREEGSSRNCNIGYTMCIGGGDPKLLRNL